MVAVQSRERQAPLLAFPMLISLLVTAVLVGLVESFVPPASIQHQQRRPSYNNVNIKHHHAPSAASPGMTAAQPLSGSRRLPTSRPGPTTSTTDTRNALRSNRPSSVYDACIGCAPLLSRVSSGDHDHDDNNNNSSGGKGGGGGGRGRGGSRGDSNDDDSGSAGDEGFGDGQPLVLAAAAGGSLAAFLDGVKDAMRQFKMPWDRKDKSSEEGQEGVAETASEEDPEKELSKVLVADVVVDNSIIPRDVLASAAVKSGLLGREASVERIQACAKILSEWYQYEGHIFSGVVNAAISPNGTVAFSVNEPVVSGVEPIQLSYYKTADIRDPNSGLVQVEKGKTKASTIAKGLGLKGGEHFKLDAQRWRGVLGSGLFSGVQLSGAHQNAEDKGMTLNINVEERNSVVFAPGVTKTLFDSNWAGEISFEEKNVLGRNGVMGLKLHRSMSSPFTSFSLSMGNNRFGQPGGWQLSFFRDCLAPYNGFARGGGGGGGYANNALGPASSAPDFSTASPAGVPRDLSMLARSIQGAQHGRGVTEGVEEASGGGNSTSKGQGARAGAAAGGGLSSSHGVSLSSSWPFAIAKVTAAAGYQQISPPTDVLRKHSSHHDDALPPPAGGAADQIADGSSGGGVAETRRGLWDDSGAMDLLTLSGGVSRDWRLPGVLRRLGGKGPSAGAAAAAPAGSVSSFLDVKTGCLLEGGVAPRPFSHESATLVHRVPVGPHGKGGSWNVTLNVRHQVQHCSKDTPLYQVPPFGGQRTVRQDFVMVVMVVPAYIGLHRREEENSMDLSDRCFRAWPLTSTVKEDNRSQLMVVVFSLPRPLANTMKEDNRGQLMFVVFREGLSPTQ
ncbi:unnamed protein product [Ectocarpus sp. 12 AP-2014]